MWNAQSHQIWQKSRAVAFNLASDTLEAAQHIAGQAESRTTKLYDRRGLQHSSSTCKNERPLYDLNAKSAPNAPLYDLNANDTGESPQIETSSYLLWADKFS